MQLNGVQSGRENVWDGLAGLDFAEIFLYHPISLQWRSIGKKWYQFD